jgi:BMFP domain-containing protein YqiC
MIESKTEYMKAREEIDFLNQWIEKLENKPEVDRENITLASVRRKLSCILEEVADYEQFLQKKSDREEIKNPKT